jgi:hypothetical protein
MDYVSRLMLSLRTNVDSLNAQTNLKVNSSFQSKTIQQLTSGYRINQSGDDAAGLAVANALRSGITELTQGVANGNDGLGQLQIIDGGLSNISNLLDRMKTLGDTVRLGCIYWRPRHAEPGVSAVGEGGHSPGDEHQPESGWQPEQAVQRLSGRRKQHG